MHRSRMKNLLLGGCAVACMLVSAGVVAQEHMSAQARFCDDFDHNVIMGGKVAEASKYLTDDFKEHNLRLQADGLEAFVAKFTRMRSQFAARPRPAGGAAAAPATHRTVLSAGDLVVFITPIPSRPNPANPAQSLPASTHFDIYRMRDGKIAEHWD